MLDRRGHAVVRYFREFWRTFRSLRRWQQVSFVVFNVFGISYASVAPFLDIYRKLSPWWLLFLWFMVLVSVVGTTLIVGQMTWKRVETDRATLRRRLRPVLRFYFSSDCCTWGNICVGVSNPSVQTIHDVEVRISIPSVGTRGYPLAWEGDEASYAISINPCSPGDHHHVTLVELLSNAVGHKHAMRLQHADYERRVMGIGQYEIFLTASGADVVATVARARLTLSESGVISVDPLPGPGMEGWSPLEA